MRYIGSAQFTSAQFSSALCDVSHPALCMMDPTLVACSMETWISPLAAAGVDSCDVLLASYNVLVYNWRGLVIIV